MKLKILATILFAAGLTACSSDDDDYTELWTVNIEPEFVLGTDYWGGYTSVHPVMEATDDAGNRTGTYMMGQIKGFEFEEGYRYKLLIEADDLLKRYEEKGVYVVDGSRYKFTLKKVLSKEYVGIREEGRRDVEMDVQQVRVRSTNETDSWEYGLCVGQVVGTDEIISMAPFEIAGLREPWIFEDWQEDGTVVAYKIRMKVSITPTDKPLLGNGFRRRIRLQEIVGKEKMENEGIIYMERDEAERYYMGI